MSPSNPLPHIGIEEEYQLVDPLSGQLRPDCEEVMSQLKDDVGAAIQNELHLSQIEMASPVCASLEDVRRAVCGIRRQLAEAAEAVGCRLVAAGTNPLPVDVYEDVTPQPRYRQMASHFKQIARGLRIFGCHVHVEMPNRELGIEVLNRSRRWLPLLQGISANSPFFEGEDTGYASFRRELWMQIPLAGPPRNFRDHVDYENLISQLVQAQAIADQTKVYWDIRLPKKIPTIEFRVFDVLTKPAHAIALVAIVRALVMQATADAQQGKPFLPTQHELLVVALWRAARYGMSSELIEPDEAIERSACDSLDRLLDYIRGPLIASGDEAVVLAFCDQLRTAGTAADRQRSIAADVGLDGLVHSLIEQTIDFEISKDFDPLRKFRKS